MRDRETGGHVVSRGRVKPPTLRRTPTPSNSATARRRTTAGTATGARPHARSRAGVAQTVPHVPLPASTTTPRTTRSRSPFFYKKAKRKMTKRDGVYPATRAGQDALQGVQVDGQAQKDAAMVERRIRYSQLSKFKRCRRSWLMEVRAAWTGARPEQTKGARDIGSIVHALIGRTTTARTGAWRSKLCASTRRSAAGRRTGPTCSRWHACTRWKATSVALHRGRRCERVRRDGGASAEAEIGVIRGDASSSPASLTASPPRRAGRDVHRRGHQDHEPDRVRAHPRRAGSDVLDAAQDAARHRRGTVPHEPAP